MSVAVITPPAALVSLALAKAQCRVAATNTTDDELLELEIAAAQAVIDGPGGWLERALGRQTLELRLDGFCAEDWRVGPDYAWDAGWSAPWPFARRIKLPFPPFVSVTSITYEDGSGADQVLTPTGWQASDEGVEPAFGTGWPSGRVAANAVRIRYVAGYDPDKVPPQAKQALLLMVADLYENRSASVIDARAVVAENPTVDRLLSGLRIYA